MYCNVCGKSVKNGAKFCPRCGARIVSSENKRIIVDNNISPETLKKRAYILIEDGDFITADEYLDRLLDLDPENAEGYLGKILVRMRKNSPEEMVRYYLDLYSNKQDSIVAAELPDAMDEHILKMAEENAVDQYLAADEIKNLYRSYDETYRSFVPCRKKQLEQIKEEFDSDTLISRVRASSDKKCKKYFNDIIKEYEKRLKEAEKEVASKAAKIIENYPVFIQETDLKVEQLHQKALDDREKDYRSYIADFENGKDKSIFESLSTRFERLGDYEEAADYKNRCLEKVSEFESEEKQRQEKLQKQKRLRIMIALACLALLIAGYFVYTNVIVPSNRYNAAVAHYENGEYEDALGIFEELGDYKDCAQRAVESHYQIALNEMKEGKYAEAIAILEKIDTIEEAKDKLLEARYGYGKKLMEDKQFDNAISQFKMTEGYSDSADLILKAKYGKALLLREQKKYDDAIKLFEELGDYEDAAEQKKTSEKEKAANSVKIPSVVGKSSDTAKKSLDTAELKYKIVEKESADKKVGTVLSISPKEGETVLKGSDVTLTVAKGLAKYETYRGNSNNKVLYQVNITSSGNNIVIRTAPHLTSSNRTGRKTKSGEAYNVYETVLNEGYTFVRTDNNEWFATQSSWVQEDKYCTSSGDFTIRQAWINDISGSGVYDRPSENVNGREWVESLDHGTNVTVYYQYYNGQHYWYKIGANRWIKDTNREKVIYY